MKSGILMEYHGRKKVEGHGTMWVPTTHRVTWTHDYVTGPEFLAPVSEVVSVMGHATSHVAKLSLY